jgi:hypothetical protein
MKSPIPINSIHSLPGNEAEETLRLIAKLSAPQGLEERMQSALRKAPRTTAVLPWPEARQNSRGWMRGAAAAAIVFVVAGGGWSIAARLHPAEPARVIAMPRVAASGGFSSAGAMRTPQTFNVPAPAAADLAKKKSAEAKPAQAKIAQAKPATPDAKLNPSR